MTNSILSTGLKGIQSALASASAHASQVSTSFQDNNSDQTVEGITGLNADKRQVQASIKVIEAAKKLDGTILDILA